MIEKLSETEDIWEHLRRTDKPIVLYGMGDGALKIMHVFDRYGIRLSGIFASDDFQRGHSFAGFPVLTLAKVKERYKDFIIVLAFGTFREPLLSYLYELSERHEFYAPDVPVCVEDEQVFTLDYIRAHEAELDKVYDRLADEQSRQVLLDTLNYKVSGKVAYLKRCTTPIEEVYEQLLHLTDHEDYVDLGAYNGDTIVEFLQHTGGRYRTITAFEPDKKNFKKLQKQMEALQLQNVTALNCGSYREKTTLLFAGKAGRNSALNAKEGVPTPVDSVDNVLHGHPATVLKLDVEGAEEQTLWGARQTIERYHPNILLSAYHKNSDLFLLPLLALSFYPDYRLYLRHHPYIPAWETNFYLVDPARCTSPMKRGERLEIH